MDQDTVDVGDRDTESDGLAVHLGEEDQVRVQEGTYPVSKAAELSPAHGHVIAQVGEGGIKEM
nr:hypothetical protein [Anaerolineae bacterium]